MVSSGLGSSSAYRTKWTIDNLGNRTEQIGYAIPSVLYACLAVSCSASIGAAVVAGGDLA
ncbi:hypothetical protein Ais01nite_65740 [Asanoa ishikariensis]|uniref:Uncharacterized protein n=1 Tax=Asanoa ishikariensis TaxID=137265 RepID=A0A1H3NLF6_9ACTN|nr:hypothetical protein [Asanoa ishikariensis]GIF68539.1 hypothetical protein Ais01nite_65740 [Asanoa ishikariensis]SDY89638.1 hypothetical protein SAMN05421684_2151 [Asanoa ishikariensis]